MCLSGKSRLGLELTAPDPLNIKQTIEYFQIKLSPDFDQYNLEEFVASGKLTPYFLFNGVLRHNFKVFNLQNLTQYDEQFLDYQYTGYVSPTELQKSVSLLSTTTLDCHSLLYVRTLQPEKLEFILSENLDNDPSYLFMYHETSRTSHETIFTIIDDLPQSPLDQETGIKVSSKKCRFIKQHLDAVVLEQQSSFPNKTLNHIEIIKNLQHENETLTDKNERLKNELIELRKIADLASCCDPNYEYFSPELRNVIKLWGDLYHKDGSHYLGNQRISIKSHTASVKQWTARHVDLLIDPSSDNEVKRYLSITTPEKLKNYKR